MMPFIYDLNDLKSVFIPDPDLNQIDQVVINVEQAAESSMIARGFSLYLTLTLRSFVALLLLFFHLFNRLLKFIFARRIIRLPLTILSGILANLLLFVILYLFYRLISLTPFFDKVSEFNIEDSYNNNSFFNLSSFSNLHVNRIKSLVANTSSLLL